MKKTLTIAPLSTPDTLTLSAWKTVETAPKLFLQTREHPSARPVLESELPFVSMDDLYTGASDYDELNTAIADRLTSDGSAVYAVMGGGCFAQLPFIQEACGKRGFELILLPGVPYFQAAFPEAEKGQVYTANDLPQNIDTDVPLYYRIGQPSAGGRGKAEASAVLSGRASRHLGYPAAFGSL